MNNALKLICLVGKYHIHEFRVLQITPNIRQFCVELQYLFDSVSMIAPNKKATETSQIIGKKTFSVQCISISKVLYPTRLEIIE